jgi:hypothetical protein
LALVIGQTVQGASIKIDFQQDISRSTSLPNICPNRNEDSSQ